MNDLEQFRILGISEAVLDALRIKGFVEPTPIQKLAIPKLMEGARDLIGQAQTGTGKTAAFGIPVIEYFRSTSFPETPKKSKVQTLVLTPTRELCCQIADELGELKGESDISILALYGGQSIEIQQRKLKKGADVVVGTPGRILDFLRRGELDLTGLEFAILDEADEMLDMGFIDDIRSILGETNPDKRMLLFSATMPPEIEELAGTFLRPGYEVLRTITPELGSGKTEEIYYEVKREDKFEALTRLLEKERDMYALIFCRTKVDAAELAEALQHRKIPAEALHGDVPQATRSKVIAQFKARKFPLLVATDVAARGIDIDDLTHVINYSLSTDPETYVHRIGRTGRAGKNGVAITFVTPGERRRLEILKKSVNTKLHQEELPGAAEMIEAKKASVTEAVRKQIELGIRPEYRKFAGELGADQPEILAALLQQMLGDKLLAEHYREIGKSPRRAGKTANGGQKKPFPGVRLFINRGKRDNFGAEKIAALIADATGIAHYKIGKIDCFDRFSFVNFKHSDDANQVLAAFKTGDVRARKAVPEGETELQEERPRKRKNEIPRPVCDRIEKTPERPEKPRRKMRDWVEKLDRPFPLKEKRAHKGFPKARRSQGK